MFNKLSCVYTFTGLNCIYTDTLFKFSKIYHWCFSMLSAVQNMVKASMFRNAYINKISETVKQVGLVSVVFLLTGKRYGSDKQRA
jgi:hypothetical protein